MLNAFLVLATLWFILLAVIWNNRDWSNLLIKTAFVAMAIMGGTITAQALGYVVRIPT